MAPIARALRFEAPPAPWPALLRAVTGRRPGLPAGATIPRIEAVLVGIPPDPARVRAYGAVCGFRDTGVLPMTYPHILGAPLHLLLATHPDFPLPALGVVHVRNSLTEHRPIADDEALTVTCAVEGHREVPPGWEFDLVTRIEAAGRPVWDAVSSILCRRRRREEGPGRDARSQAAAGSSTDAADASAPCRRASWELPADLGRRYGRVSGDRNPIHMYALTARPFGFRRAIVHGMWSLARCLAELEGDLPDPPRTATVQFHRPVLLPARVDFEARPALGGRAFVLARPGDGKPHLTGSVVAAAGPAP